MMAADLITLDPAVDVLLAWRDDVLSEDIPTFDGLVDQACAALEAQAS